MPDANEKISENEYTGYEVELWKKIAQQLNLSYEFQENTGSFADILQAKPAKLTLASLALAFAATVWTN